MDQLQIKGLVFDLGGVVIDWNPRHLYNKIFDGDTARADWFLANICTLTWNEEQDAGRSLAEGTDELVGRFPEWEGEIRAYYSRWIEMIGGQVPGTSDLLHRLREMQYRLFALSNWSCETFPLIQPSYGELALFEKVFLSGNFGVAKPDPKFFVIALSQIGVSTQHLVFIDDNPRNVSAAAALGIRSLLFVGAAELARDLRGLGVPV